jgi:hypothetical protein
MALLQAQVQSQQYTPAYTPRGGGGRNAGGYRSGQGGGGRGHGHRQRNYTSTAGLMAPMATLAARAMQNCQAIKIRHHLLTRWVVAATTALQHDGVGQKRM